MAVTGRGEVDAGPPAVTNGASSPAPTGARVTTNATKPPSVNHSSERAVRPASNASCQAGDATTGDPRGRIPLPSRPHTQGAPSLCEVGRPARSSGADDHRLLARLVSRGHRRAVVPDVLTDERSLCVSGDQFDPVEPAECDCAVRPS